MLDYTDSGTGVTDAEENWWGCNEGPEDSDCDSVAGPVDFDPWLVLDLTAPNSVEPNESVGARASVDQNSDGDPVSGAMADAEEAGWPRRPAARRPSASSSAAAPGGGAAASLAEGR